MISSEIEQIITGWKVHIYVDGKKLADKLFFHHDQAESYALIVENCRTVSINNGRLLFEK